MKIKASVLLMRTVFSVIIFFICISIFTSQTRVFAAISDLPPYGTKVETWWNTFWANPLSPTFIPLGQIPSPTNTVTISPGANLQNTIDAFPTSGGTILLNPGEYSGDIRIYGRNNIHIRGLGTSPTDVVLTGAIFVAGCKEASYGFRPDGYDYFVGGIFRNTQYNIDCVAKNRATNIYFYNFTMDAKGRMDPAQNWIELANGVVFDKIYWQGLTNDPSKVHWGHANGHVMEDNIWFRGNVFKGTYQTAIYLDGCHSCGVIGSTIEANFFNSGLIFMDNNDLDYDYNKNGVFDPNELRNGRYQVVAFNNFVPSSNPSVVTTYDWFNVAILYETGNVLTINNSVTANTNVFSFIKGACSYHTPVVLDFYDLVYKNNYVKTGGTDFFQIEYNTQYCTNVGGASTYRLGNYTVSNNSTLNAGASYNFAKELTTSIDGPNTVLNNCRGTTCPDPRTPVPTGVVAPTQPAPTNTPRTITSTPVPPTATNVPPTILPTPTTVPTSCNEDINSDGIVDIADFGLLASNFLKVNPSNIRIDINRDGIVDLSDYAKLVLKFLKTCSTTSPTSVSNPTPTTTTQPSSYFPYGIFEDGNSWGGSAARAQFVTDLRKFKANGIDDLIYTNFTPHPDLTDQEGVNVVAAPMEILNPAWWSNSSTPETIENARTIAYPIVDALASHTSVKAFNLVDDADHYTASKIALMTQAFNERSGSRPSFPMAPSESRFKASNAPVYMGYIYPALITNNQCDFHSASLMGRYVNNFAQALQIDRENLGIDKNNIPHWTVLQSHGYQSGVNPAEPDVTKLRTPSPEEARLQNWIALGEGVDGISWFIYKTQQFWIGLDQNTTLWNEVVSLASRVKPLRATLLTLKKYDLPVFTATAQNNLLNANLPYISTMSNQGKTKWYVIVANHSCTAQSIQLSSAYSTSQLKDVETGTLYNEGQYIAFRGGDGKMFEVMGTVTPPAITASTNITTNPSFETGTGTDATGWNEASGMSRDTSTAKSGTASMKLTGPIAANYSVVPIGTLKPNTQYSVSYWVKTQNVSGSGVGLRYAHISPNLGFTPPPNSLGSVNGTSTDFKQVTSTFYTFEEMTQARFDLQFELTTGTAWIDDIIICEGHLGCGGLF